MFADAKNLTMAELIWIKKKCNINNSPFICSSSFAFFSVCKAKTKTKY